VTPRGASRRTGQLDMLSISEDIAPWQGIFSLLIATLVLESSVIAVGDGPRLGRRCRFPLVTPRPIPVISVSDTRILTQCQGLLSQAGGPPCSGKSSLARELFRIFPAEYRLENRGCHRLHNLYHDGVHRLRESLYIETRGDAFGRRLGRHLYRCRARYALVKGMGVPWQTALGAVFISGVAFLLLTALGIRQWIISAIPAELYAALSAGIVFLANVSSANSATVTLPGRRKLAGAAGLHAATSIVTVMSMFSVMARGSPCSAADRIMLWHSRLTSGSEGARQLGGPRHLYASVS
jgi:hypothetical protein